MWQDDSILQLIYVTPRRPMRMRLNIARRATATTRVSVSALQLVQALAMSVVGVTDTRRLTVWSLSQYTASWPCMYSPVLHSAMPLRKRPIMSAGVARTTSLLLACLVTDCPRRYVHVGWCCSAVGVLAARLQLSALSSVQSTVWPHAALQLVSAVITTVVVLL